MQGEASGGEPGAWVSHFWGHMVASGSAGILHWCLRGRAGLRAVRRPDACAATAFHGVFVATEDWLLGERAAAPVSQKGPCL